MAAGGETYDTDFGGVDAVLVGVVIDIAEGIQDVLERVRPFVAKSEHAETEDVSGNGCDAELQDVGVDAIFVQPLGHADAFYWHIEPGIAASRANDCGDAGVRDGVRYEVRGQPLTAKDHERNDQQYEQKPFRAGHRRGGRGRLCGRRLRDD